jgi:hypothetical protein
MSKRHPIPPLRGHESRAGRLTWSNGVRDWRSDEQNRIRESRDQMPQRTSGDEPSRDTGETTPAQP